MSRMWQNAQRARVRGMRCTFTMPRSFKFPLTKRAIPIGFASRGLLSSPRRRGEEGLRTHRIFMQQIEHTMALRPLSPHCGERARVRGIHQTCHSRVAGGFIQSSPSDPSGHLLPAMQAEGGGTGC